MNFHRTVPLARRPDKPSGILARRTLGIFHPQFRGPQVAVATLSEAKFEEMVQKTSKEVRIFNSSNGEVTFIDMINSSPTGVDEAKLTRCTLDKFSGYFSKALALCTQLHKENKTLDSLQRLLSLYHTAKVLFLLIST